MQSKKPFLFLLSFFLLAGLFLSCSSTEGQGGNVTEPSATAPTIVEGFMCTEIYEDNPVGIDNDFFVDDVVYIWLSWKNVAGAHDVKIVWVDPNEKLFETANSFTSRDGTMTTYYWLDTTNSAPVGRWLAEVYIDGIFMRSYAFWLNSVS